MVTLISTARSYPTGPYEDIAKHILGKRYDITLVFVGAKKVRQLNKIYRNKTYTPNVLSFPLTDNVGEIYICPVVARKEAAKFGLSYEGYIAYLFIHGCLHLKGMDHGDAMDKAEARWTKKFGVR